jgi:2-polyprenyl-3-methyl-5-hydroxy-6-metoxy-1,4-benzoquinol methylase/tetratricopeptide (TPR) repeat protein
LSQIAKTDSEAEIYARAEELFSKNDFDGAIESLDRLFEINGGNAAALALAGNIYAAGGDILQAMGHYGLAIQVVPDNPAYKRQFIKIAGNMILSQYNPAIEEILCLCLETPEVECAHAQNLWYTLVRSHPQFQPLLKWVLEGNILEKADDLSFLLQPVFTLGIQRIVVGNPEFEKFMTELRRFLLGQIDSPQEKLPAGHYHSLLEATAAYCFHTDYIFNRTEAEEKAIGTLQKELETSSTARQDIVKTGLYACYEPLYKLRAAQDMACLPAIKIQVDDYFDLLDRAVKIPSLTEITDPVSLRVREQYEEFPYPRWRELSPQAPGADSLALSQAPRPQILIAGCGTGQEPLRFAQSCPAASILAVDLSRISLAYASRKGEELGIKNVEFRHADILQLGSLNRTFDSISSMGVLHHMQDPVAGWKILTELLNPSGMMRIGLYSVMARRPVTAAREAIHRGGYPNTAAGMRRFRKDSENLTGRPPQGKIFDTMDYYCLNMYRDLLFHVQEHQFSLPQIKDILTALNLEFIGLSVSEAAHQHYRQYFPDDPQERNLDNWHRMELANPDMFVQMYVFWCRKKP